MNNNHLYNKRYSPKYIVELAQKFRNNMTPAEKVLWLKLNNKQVNGLKFRKQHPIDRYIADFYCHEIGLIIEIDGEIHENQKEYDENRNNYLSAGNYTVLRFSNDDIIHSLNDVLYTISKCAYNIRKTKEL